MKMEDLQVLSAANGTNTHLESQMSALQLELDIKLHSFKTRILDNTYFFQVTNLGRTSYLWIGSGDGVMNDLAMSALTPYDKKGMPLSTKIVGVTNDNLSESIAAKLTKKLGKPIYVSFNIELGPMYSTILRDIEDRLYEEIAMCPDKF